MPKISVIVPVYNVEKCLGRCIDSILNQTFGDFELILVNDGSKDNSGKMCDKYAQQDSRIIVIHKENGGVSTARNAGINRASGDYIMFVDSDDYILETMLEDMEALAGDETDCILTSATILAADNKVYNKCISDSDTSVSELMNQYCMSVIPTILVDVPWCKLYKRNIIKEFDIHFDTNLSYGEDAVFNMTYLKECKNIKTSKNAYYVYDRSNENSLSQKIYKDRISQWDKVINKTLDTAEALNCSENSINILKQSYIREMLNYLDIISIKNGKKDAVVYIKDLADNEFFINNIDIYKTNVLRKTLALLIYKRRCNMAYIMSKIMKLCYDFMVFVYMKIKKIVR